MKIPIAFAFISLVIALLFVGCRQEEPTVTSAETGQTAPQQKNGDREIAPEKLLQQQARQLAGDGDFYLKFWVVEMLPGGVEGQRASGNLFCRAESSLASDVSYANGTPTITNSIVLAGGEYSSHGFRVSVHTNLERFDESGATFIVNGEYEFRRPKVESDESSRLPFVWYGKTELPDREVVVPWNADQVVSYDISDIQPFALFKEKIGDEIRIKIVHPTWSHQPIDEETASD